MWKILSSLRTSMACFLGLCLLPLASASTTPLRVVTTTTILEDLVREVGGDRVQARSLVPRGVDLHGYEPSAAQVRDLARADLVVMNGLGLEGWLGRLVRNAGYRGPVVIASTGVQALHNDGTVCCPGHAHDHGEHDPHIWHDLSNVMVMVENIRSGLATVDPSHAAEYHASAQVYLTKLEEMDRWARAELAKSDLQQVLFIPHNALRYLAHAYGLDIRSLMGTDTHEEPNARQMAGLVRDLRQARVAGVFSEMVTDRRILDVFIREGGFPYRGELFTDTLASPGHPGDTFLSMFRHNIERILESLGS